MKHLNLTAVVLGLACVSLSAYPVWDEQKERFVDETFGGKIDYDMLLNIEPEREYFKKLSKGELKELHGQLQKLSGDMDGDCMNFLGQVQSLSKLSDRVKVFGKLAEVIDFKELPAPIAIYIYLCIYYEDLEDVRKGYDEYVDGVLVNPFAKSNDPFKQQQYTHTHKSY